MLSLLDERWRDEAEPKRTAHIGEAPELGGTDIVAHHKPMQHLPRMHQALNCVQREYISVSKMKLILSRTADM